MILYLAIKKIYLDTEQFFQKKKDFDRLLKKLQSGDRALIKATGVT